MDYIHPGLLVSPVYLDYYMHVMTKRKVHYLKLQFLPICLLTLWASFLMVHGSAHFVQVMPKIFSVNICTDFD